MAPLPPLHIAQAATRVTTLDGDVTTIVAAALIVVLALIWRDHLHLLLHRRSARTLTVGLAAIAIVFALLPAVVPYDHLFFEHAAVSQAEETAHSMHCHLAPGACADAPISAGPGQFIFSDPPLLTAAMLSVVMYLATRTLQGRTLRPDLRPPIA
jgi:hypothetical protein